MGRPTKEYQAFDHMRRQTADGAEDGNSRRHAEHRERSAQNPRKRGPKPKVTPPSATDPGGESGNG